MAKADKGHTGRLDVPEPTKHSSLSTSAWNALPTELEVLPLCSHNTLFLMLHSTTDYDSYLFRFLSHLLHSKYSLNQ